MHILRARMTRHPPMHLGGIGGRATTQATARATTRAIVRATTRAIVRATTHASDHAGDDAGSRGRPRVLEHRRSASRSVRADRLVIVPRHPCPRTDGRSLRRTRCSRGASRGSVVFRRGSCASARRMSRRDLMQPRCIGMQGWFPAGRLCISQTLRLAPIQAEPAVRGEPPAPRVMRPDDPQVPGAPSGRPVTRIALTIGLPSRLSNAMSTRPSSTVTTNDRVNAT